MTRVVKVMNTDAITFPLISWDVWHVTYFKRRIVIILFLITFLFHLFLPVDVVNCHSELFQVLLSSICALSPHASWRTERHFLSFLCVLCLSLGAAA